MYRNGGQHSLACETATGPSGADGYVLSPSELKNGNRNAHRTVASLSALIRPCQERKLTT